MAEILESEKPHVALTRAIAESLCDYPEQIRIEDTIDERGVLVRLYVAQPDIKRLIGKAGETANSIRTIMRAVGLKNDARISFKVDEA